MVLLSPHLGFATTSGDDSGRGVDDPSSDVDDVTATWLCDAYRGALKSDDPKLSSLLADLRGLPPVLVQVGSTESTFDHGVRFVRRAKLAGNTATLDVWHGMWHTWHYHRELPEAANALDEAGRFIAELGQLGLEGRPGQR